MKTQIQIRTGDFEYIMQEYDEPITAEKAVAAYHLLKDSYKGGEGATSKEIDTLLDSYFKGNGVSADVYAKLNPEQSKWVQAIKRSLARIKNKEDEIE